MEAVVAAAARPRSREVIYHVPGTDCYPALFPEEAVVAAAVAATQIGGLETAPAVVATQVSVVPGLGPMSSIAAVAVAVAADVVVVAAAVVP